MSVDRQCYFFKTYILLLWCFYEPQVEAIAPTFLVPIASTPPRAVNENCRKGLSILTVEGQDGDGDTLTFSISTQSPISPSFELDCTTGTFKTPNGLDAETTQSFNFTFSMSDGTTTVDSVIFTVNINDQNDNIPQFVGEPYSAQLLDSVGDSTHVVRVLVTDLDVTPTRFGYSISDGNTGNTFAITGNGQVIVAKSTNLVKASTFNLVVQVSDGSNIITTTASVTVNVDYCHGGPCVNGACINGNANYTCNCTPGFLGVNCSKVDYCHGDPLVNGTCINGNAKSCNCTAGFLGVNCSEVDYCATNPCQNGGTCTNGATTYTCTCTSGYTGTNCTEIVDYCATNPCQNGGTCTNGATTYTCTCTSGYTGTNCTEIVDYCATNPCQNGGTCTNGATTYTCTCTSGYTGTNCTEIGQICKIGCCKLCVMMIAGLSLVILVFLLFAIVIYLLHQKKVIKLFKLPCIEKCLKDNNTKPGEDPDVQPVVHEGGESLVKNNHMKVIIDIMKTTQNTQLKLMKLNQE